MSKRNQRQGFTLVEMLVVISIVVILAGLLIPAIGGVRAAARKKNCANNLQQLSAAVITFEQSKGRFPGSREMIATRGAGVGQNKWATWNVMILPYIDQNPLWEAWDDPQIALVTGPPAPPCPLPIFTERLIPSLPMYRCASDTTLQDVDICLSSVPPDSSYIANGGMLPRPAIDPAPYNLDPASYLRVMNRNTGVFHDLIARPTARFTFDMLHDGAGNTIMLSENLQAQWWFFTGNPNQFGVLPTAPTPNLNRLSTMGYFLYTQAPQLSAGQPVPVTVVIDEMRINGGSPETDPLRPTTARPSSRHKGGVNVAFCDRSVSFVRENIDYHVYAALMTPRDKKADIPWREFLVKAEDYLSE